MRQRIKTILLVLTSGLLTSSVYIHPFYISVTHIKHNATLNNLEVSVKIFANDFEETLKKNNHTKIDLLHQNESDSLNNYVNQYILSHLKLSCNNKPLQQKYLGFEMEQDVIWIYLEYSTVKTIQHLEIENSILCESFMQQTNIIRLEYQNKDFHTKLNCPEKYAMIKP